MEFNPFPIALPAIIALIAKIIIFAYARSSRTHNLQTRLFLWALFALAVQNLTEIDIVYRMSQGGLPVHSFTVFYASAIIALSLFTHLAAHVAIGDHLPRLGRAIIVGCYVYAATLLLLLFFTATILGGATVVDYNLASVPGSHYALFEVYVVSTCIGLLALFSYGALRQETAASRAKNALLLAGMFPALVVVITVLTLLHFDIKWVNAATILPLAITLFVVVSAYAIYEHRIFDIQIFIPWSKTRRRKTAFHSGVRRLIAEVAELPSASQIVRRLSDTLRCPVALLGPNRALFAGDSAKQMANLPQEELNKIEQIVVAEEILESRPGTYSMMKSNGIAAIVPFYPHSETVSGWLLLGDSFNEQVHSPLDFRLVEELFGKMSELFIDRFVTLRSQLRAANRQLYALTTQNESLQEQLGELEKERHSWRVAQSAVINLDNKRDVDQVVQSLDPDFATPLTFVGRDKEMVRALKQNFRAVKSFVGPGSSAFRRADTDGLIVVNVADASPKLARFLDTRSFPGPMVLYGSNVESVVEAHRPQLRNLLVDIIPGHANPALICSRANSLMYLCKHLYSLSYDQQPLLGESPAFTLFVQQLQIFAGFKDPVLFLYDDPELTLSAARYVHEYSNSAGKLVKASAQDLNRLKSVEGTILLLGFHELNEEEQEQVATLLQERDENSARLIIGCHYDYADSLNERVRILTQGFSIDVPRLHERRDDVPLLMHYYTLGFNLNSCSFKGLTRAEVRSLKLHEPSWTLQGLRRATIEFLANKTQGTEVDETEDELDFATSASIEAVNQEQNLEELVAEFESRIIRQALERCDGNKSKTARILGLRANTLHYKLERYGLSDTKRGRRPKT